LSEADKQFNKGADVVKLQHIAVMLIFTAHASISDSSRELIGSGEVQLKQVLASNLPNKALGQIA